jgi:hypothetical protein
VIRERVGRHDFEFLAQLDDGDHAALARQVEVASGDHLLLSFVIRDQRR